MYAVSEKTLILKIRVGEPVERVLIDYSQSCSRWLNTAFALLYDDKRHQGSKTYGELVTPKTRKDGTPTGKFWTDDSAVYKSLVSSKDTPHPIPTDIAHKRNVQTLSKKLVTVWGGFPGPSKGRAVPRPKGHLPKFRPVCYVGNQMAKLEDDGMTVSIPYPLSHGRQEGEHRRISVELVPSHNPRYKIRLDAFRHRMKRTMKSGSLTAPSLEIRRHEDGAWYIHVPVEDVRPQVTPAGRALGVDLGERNTATTALVSNPDGKTLLATHIYSGLPTRHALDLITARRRKLRRKLDRGSRGARDAWDRLRDKMVNINETLAQQASAAIVKTAVQEGVSLIAVEDLRGGFRPLHKRGEESGLRTYGIRKWNHRLGRWNRGAVRDDLTYKAKAAGIQVKEVYARGTSSQCPNCHPTGWLAEGEMKRGRRNRKGHVFQCNICGYSRNDDETGAINIARRGLNKRPQRVIHDPTLGSDAEGEGSSVCKDARRGHLPAPETARRGGENVATVNGAFLDRNEKGTTGTRVIPAQAGKGSGHLSLECDGSECGSCFGVSSHDSMAGASNDTANRDEMKGLSKIASQPRRGAGPAVAMTGNPGQRGRPGLSSVRYSGARSQ